MVSHLKNKIFIVLFILFSSIRVFSQVTEDEILLNVGDDVLTAPIPTTIDGYKNILSTVVNMYNKLNDEHNTLLTQLETEIKPEIVNFDEIIKELEDQVSNFDRIQDNITYTLDLMKKEINKDRNGVSLSYSFLGLSDHVFGINWIISKFGLFFGSAGPMVVIKDKSFSNIGVSLAIGIWL